jgi:methionyl aminopeptidase
VIELKTADEIDKMAVTGEFVAETLATLSLEAQPGVNLMQLEHHARGLVTDRGATSCYWDYAPSFGRGPFRNVICLSVNDAVLHGMPHDYVLRDGDVLSLDFAVSIDGWVADSAVTVIVGDDAEVADEALIDSTRKALQPGIAAAVPFGRLTGRTPRTPSTPSRSPNAALASSLNPVRCKRNTASVRLRRRVHRLRVVEPVDDRNALDDLVA